MILNDFKLRKEVLFLNDIFNFAGIRGFIDLILGY
jgi:hypothetical protein